MDDAPGAFDISNADNMDYMLGFPGPSVANLVDAASLMHMMNANTFTCGAYHLSDDVSAADVASSLRDNIMNRQWIAASPTSWWSSPWASLWCPSTVPRIWWIPSGISSRTASPPPL